MVGIYSINQYDYDKIFDIVNNIFNEFGLDKRIKKGMNVVIKPDLTPSEEGKDFSSSNILVIKAVAKKVMLCEANVTIVDRTEGIFNEKSINEEYEKLGLLELEEQGINLNRDCKVVKADVKSDSDIDKVEIIATIKNADFVINLPKLKTHMLFGLCGATVNMFSSITSESMKNIFGKYEESSKISKIALMVARSIKNQFTIMDGIVAMDGNGYLNGNKVNFGHIIASDSLTELDYTVSKRICKMYKQLPIISEIIRVSQGKTDMLDNIEVREEKTKYKQFKFPLSVEKLSSLDKLLGKKVWPKINEKKCIKCKICVLRCPTKVIEEENHKIVMKNRHKCTRCMHCVSQCPVNAIYVKKMRVKISKKQIQMLNEAKGQNGNENKESIDG